MSYGGLLLGDLIVLTEAALEVAPYAAHRENLTTWKEMIQGLLLDRVESDG